MIIKKFKVVSCHKCGQKQVMGGLAFKCKICNKTTKLKLKSKFGLNLKIYGHFETGNEAQKFLTEMQNEKINEKRVYFEEYK